MTPQPAESFSAVGADNTPEDRDRVQYKTRAPFVKPRLVCHGAVADLTGVFGGSITPNDLEAQENQ
jgi:hypothetical protein